METIQKLRRIIKVLLSWGVYFFSFSVSRNKKIWIFIGWRRGNQGEIFADNSKYIFLHVANTRKDIRAIWIGEDDRICDVLHANGYESYKISSREGIYYSLRAGYTFIDAFMRLRNWRYSGRSKVVQLWHGEGVKKTWRDDSHYRAKYNSIISPNLFKNYHFLVASSECVSKHFVSPSFGVSKEKVCITGLPRYDVFFNEIPGSRIDINLALEWELKKIKLQNPKKIILYAPTFRRGMTEEDPLSAIRLSKLNEFFQKRRYFMVVSLHPKFSTKDWMPENTFTNISFVNPDYDTYPLLSNFDLLITDYSSLCMEFLLLEKPTIFFTYDIERYKKDPGLIENIWDLLPGPRVATLHDLLHALDAKIDNRQKDCKNAKEALFDFREGHSSQRVIKQIVNISH